MDHIVFFDEFFSAFVSNHIGLQGDPDLRLISQKIFRKHFALVIEELRDVCDISCAESAFKPLRRAEDRPIDNFPTPEFLEFEREIRNLLEGLDATANRRVARILFQCLREFVSHGVDISRRIIRVVQNYPSAHRDFEFEYFLVHGTDSNDEKGKIISFLTQLGLPPPKILVREAGRGSTLLAKFEQSAQLAKAAIVLVTPDDVGKRRDESDLKPRARQNVWFEAGFFRGILPKHRVIFLKSADVEIPSDIGNVAYVDLSVETWKKLFFKELVEAEIPVHYANAPNVW